MGLETLAIEKFLGMSENPLYSQPKGKLKLCDNFTVNPDGILQARGGLEKLKPSGGTATAPISAGFYTGATEHISPVGWIYTYDGVSTYSNNLALQAYYAYFAGTAVGQTLIFVAPFKFSRIVLNIGVAGTGGYTTIWEYRKSNGSDATLSGVTEDFKATGTRTLAFSPPSDWGRADAGNNVYGYRISVRIATAVLGTIPRQKDSRVSVNWRGMKQIYLGASDEATGTANGLIKRCELPTSAAAWPAITTSLASTGNPRIRFASWRGYLYAVNGIEAKRYNLDTVADMGFAGPGGALTAVAVGGGGTGNLTGTFLYAVTYGYGAAGELGESTQTLQTSTAAPAIPAAQNVTVTLSAITGTPAAGTVDVIYLYRSRDLSTVTLASSYGAFPMDRIATITRDATGAFPATYSDTSMVIPVPLKSMPQVGYLPPSGARFVATHRSRMFLGGTRDFPGRVYWSNNFEPESFNTDEQFADFSRAGGGEVVSMIEFADQVVVFTEDATFGIANVDQDPPNVYVIAAGVGCIAGDAVKIVNGILIWPGRGGIYAWDGMTTFDPVKNRISDDMPFTLGKLSAEAHGGSRALSWSTFYKLILIDASDAATAARHCVFNIATRTWTVETLYLADVNIGYLTTVTAPPGHEDFGQRHPLYGKIQATGTDYHVYLGEWKTTDDGNAITYKADAHFGPGGARTISPGTLAAIYTNPSAPAWTTPISLSLTTASWIGDPAAVGSVFTDAATDYVWASAPVTLSSAYSGDVVGRFSATSQAGGTAGRQFLNAMYLVGNVQKQPTERTT